MAEPYVDQAAGLRRMFSRERLRVVTFASGSQGVGKSVLVSNLAASLAQQGRSVLILDENTKKTVASCFGAESRYDLFHAINGEKTLDDVLVGVSPSIHVLPAAKAVKKLGKLSVKQQRVLSDSFSSMIDPPDVILVDTSADHPLGFSPFGLAAHDTVIVMSPTPASITEAYALIKKVSLGYARRSYHILVNGARGAEEARSVFGNIARVTHSRGFARISFAGGVPLDVHMQQAAGLCQPVGDVFPDSAAAKACRKVAGEMLGWQLPEENSGGIEHFVQQLLHFSQQIDPVAIYA